MLRILTGRAGDGALEMVLEQMCKAEGRQILLTPEQFSHDAERSLCRIGGPSACLDKEVLSFTRLARRVAESAGGGAVETLDAGGRILLMHAAVQAVADKLTVYRVPSRKPTFLSGLLTTLDECKSYQVDPEELFSAGEALTGTQGDKLRDLGLIFGAYDALVGRSAVDPRDALDRLAEGLERSRWAAGIGVWVWGFTDFTPQEGGVLRALLRDAEAVCVALTLDRAAPDPWEVFAPAKRTAAYLNRLAESAGTEVEESTLCNIPSPVGAHVVRQPDPGCAPVMRANDVRPCKPPAAPISTLRAESLRHLERALFAPETDVWEGPCSVEVYAAADCRSEVERTAAEILRLVREEGFRFRDIAVCARNFDPYADLVEGVFEKYGVPVFLSTVNDVLQKPILALVTGALDAVTGDYAYEDVFRYLKTGLTDISDDDRDVLENYVLTWNLRGSRWTGAKDWDMHPEGYGRPFTPEDEALLVRLNTLRRRVTAPLEGLRKNRDRTGRGYALALYRCLEDIGLPARLEEREQFFTQEGELKLAAEYSQLWDILCNGLEQCAILLDDTTMDLETFSRLFALVLSQYDVGSIPVSLDRVTAGECTRMDGRQCKALFWLGADSASVPQNTPNPGLLTDRDRDALAGLDLPLAPRLEDKLTREMTIVYETCAVPTHCLCVSWARAAEDGERAPSFLVERLRAIFPDLTDTEAGLDSPWRLAAPRPALEMAVAEPAVAAALKTFPEYRALLERQEQAAFWRRGRLSLSASRTLYGETVPLSATRLDNLRTCHFQHFLRFGLKVRPRQRADFQATDYGTFVHAVLERVLREAFSQPEGLFELSTDSGKRTAVTEAAAEAYVEENLRGVEESGRLRYLFERMKRAIHTVVDSAVSELAVSDFQPAAFELEFGRGKTMPPIQAGEEVQVSVSGAVDRVDTWLHDGKRYLRVVDYKTGKKEFDFTDLKNGRGMQMLLYLFALRKHGKEILGPEEIVPAGVLYFPARNPLVDGSRNMSPEELMAAVDRDLVRRGLVLDEPEVLAAMERTGGKYRYLPVDRKGDFVVTGEQMQALESLVAEELERAAAELAQGKIDADPFWRGPVENACRWCDYAAACHFEPACGDERRWEKSVGAREFWEALGQTRPGGWTGARPSGGADGPGDQAETEGSRRESASSPSVTGKR